MSRGFTLEAMQIGGDSVLEAVGLVAVEVAIPPLDDGSMPKFLLVQSYGNQKCFVRPVQTGGAITTATGVLIPEFGVPVIFNVTGSSHMAHIGTGACSLKLTPLANQ